MILEPGSDIVLDPARVLGLLDTLAYPIDLPKGGSFSVGVVVPIEVYSNILSILNMLAIPAQGET